MQLVTRGALKRLPIGLPLLAGIVVAGMLYMRHCPAAGERAGEFAPVSPDNLRQHVTTLATEIGERHVAAPASLRLAANYLEQTWRAQGWTVQRQEFRAGGVDCANLEVELPGTIRPREIVVIGAHYDSAPGCPAANDNASGVAALLELSRLFAGKPQARTIRFVAFANEELFKTPAMGSPYYAQRCRQRGEDVRGMLSLETIGYYSDVPGSQRYPVPFGWFYPDRGNFVAFIGNFGSRAMLHEALRGFRAHTDFPVQSCTTFAGVPGVDWSDHWAFWQAGYPAGMVTDTAPYRYDYYHTAADTPEKLDYRAMARVTQGVAGAVARLARGGNGQ